MIRLKTSVLLPGLALVALASLAPPAQAQVPEGWYVVSSVKPYGPHEGIGGLFLVHPDVPGAPIRITGLTHELTGRGTNELKGASTVKIRPSDGALIVGEAGPVGTRIHLHLITISISYTAGRPSGASVVSDTKYDLGFAFYEYGGEISQTDLLPDGRVLVSTWGIKQGVLGDHDLGIVDLDTGVVTGVDLGATMFPTSMCLDPAGTTAWFFSDNGGFPRTANLYSVPVPAGGEPTLHGVVTGSVQTAMAYDSARGLMVAGTGESDGSAYGAGSLLEIDLGTGAVSQVPTSFGWINTLSVEKVTGEYVIGVAPSMSTPSPLYKVTPDAYLSALLVVFPGFPTGIDINATPDIYGLGTPGVNSYTWSLTPNAGGLPTIGNADFSLDVVATPGRIPDLSVYVFSLGQASFTAFDVTVLVNLSAGLKVHQDLLDTSGHIDIQIPDDLSLLGLEAFGQSFHREATGWAASGGVKFTLL